MSRYIDADEFLKEYCEPYPHVYMAMSKALADAPSIDIVRCKECRHWNEEDHWCNIRDSYGWDYKADDYCSYGQKGDENVETD